MFLSAGRVIKVGDLGVAKLLTNSEPLARTSIGTPYYISPEIWNHKPYGPKSDVWSLGTRNFHSINLFVYKFILLINISSNFFI